MNENILVPLDGSDASFKALDLAADLAMRYGSKLHLLHVTQSREIPAALRHWAQVEHVQSPPEWLLEEAVAENVLTGAEDRARARGVESIERSADHGDIATCIIEAAKGHHADMIVMGTRGLSDLEGLVLGSVAHKVTHHAPCTVVTVR